MRNAAIQRIGDALRAARLHRRRRVRRVAACAALIAVLGATAVVPPHPRLLWNASASAPIGLWRVTPDTPLRRGDMVIARLAEPWRGLAARRHYLPANVPLIKRIAAEPGDEVCAIDTGIFVNGRRIAIRRAIDASGRPMPRWQGCTVLRDGAMLLLMDDPASFDGRYFGPTARGDIIGKAAPLWLR
ncbi:S26 family signal peptidase [Sphingomonas koreensis]|uniref:S26 family signal peptidase n=1 Tax=Sphingomonas koreensis TaxID=93064 RepID=UPI000829CABE|nr:S26 family signal peptidase [Sphingomonas koreensis]PJI87169.1 conjugative transfer signal peptidase TraF [Sphingomonas koreensis]